MVLSYLQVDDPYARDYIYTCHLSLIHIIGADQEMTLVTNGDTGLGGGQCPQILGDKVHLWPESYLEQT